MSVRVVARVRPLLKSERELDVIVRTGTSATTTEAKLRETENGDRKLAALRDRDNVVRIPNPKNEGEEYTFNFNAVYDSDVVQQELFDAEGRLLIHLAWRLAINIEGKDTDRLSQWRPPSNTSSMVSMSLSSPTGLLEPGKHIPCAAVKALQTEV